MCADLFCEPVRECPLFTVIVPVYNAAAYLGQCLESIRTQSFADWEAICVDDGSQDASPDMLRQYAARDDRFRVLSQKNRGVAAARNRGLDVARGRYILFVDAGDFLAVEALEMLSRCLRERELELLCFGASHGAQESLEAAEPVLSEEVAHDPADDACLARIQHTVWGKVFRRELIERHHLRFFEEVQVGADLFFVLAYVMMCRSCGTERWQQLYKYRVEPGVTDSLYERWKQMEDPALLRMFCEPLMLLDWLEPRCSPDRMKKMQRALLARLTAHLSWRLARIEPQRRRKLLLAAARQFLRVGRMGFFLFCLGKAYPGLPWVRRWSGDLPQCRDRGSDVEDEAARAKGVVILNFAGCGNYGANLTAYALRRQCLQWGYRADIMNRRHVYYFGWPVGDGAFWRFGKRHLSWSRRVCGPADMVLLARRYETFIVGSDQVWAYQPTWGCGLITQREMFDFAELPSHVRRLAMAASFGSADHSMAPAEFIRQRRAALQRFQAISVRETGGVAICRDVYGVPAVQVFDPVFLLSGREWETLAGESQRVLPDSYAVFCVLHRAYVSMAHRVATALQEEGLSPVHLLQGEEVTDWLMSIRHAQVVVTDSFHVACFAIIFRRPLVLFQVESRGGERLPSLLQLLQADFPLFGEEALLQHADETLPRILEACRRPVSYEAIVPVLEEHICRTRAFLAQALRTPIPRADVPFVYDQARARAERRQIRYSLVREMGRTSLRWGYHLLRSGFSAESRRKRRACRQRLQVLWHKMCS